MAMALTVTTTTSTSAIMTTVPSSPSTPSRKRRSVRLSSHEISQDSTISPSPYASATTNGTTYSRRSSRTSQTSYQPQSPTGFRPGSSTSHRPFTHRRKSSSRLSIGSNISLDSGGAGGQGLGNLADELDGAWDQDDFGDEGSFLDGPGEGDVEYAIHSPTDMESQTFDLGYGLPVQSPSQTESSRYLPSQHLSPRPRRTRTNSRHQKTDSLYDGSDYGPESEDDSDVSFPPLLAKRIRDIEDVTRMSTNVDTMSEGGGVISRTTRNLKDLGPQSSIENGIGRLITAYTSMATHRSHKTRELFSHAYSILYGGLLFELPEEFIDALITETESLSAAVPFMSRHHPTSNPLIVLQTLASTTSDLLSTLRSLTDVLQESRHLSNTATRKLKSTREMVEEMRTEEELRETSVMLIQAGDWDRRCKERHAARTCREIVSGFGELWGVTTDKSDGFMTNEIKEGRVIETPAS